jgi:predicted phosphodiesterase
MNAKHLLHWTLTIVSISILVFSLIPQLSANSTADTYINKPNQSLSIGNIQAQVTNQSTAHGLIVPEEEKSYHDFVSVGDWGCTEETDKTVENILKRDPNLIIALGDYSYSNSGKCWFDKIKPIEELVKIVFGNHENKGNYHLNFFESPKYSTPDEYMNQFGLKSQYYSFDYVGVHFLMMSTDVLYEKDSPQYEFVSNDLKKASENSKTKWIIVANHRTIYPPYYGPAIALDATIGKKFRDAYHPLFDLYGVDLVLQGHVHYYQRTYPLKYNSINPDVPTITDFHKNHYIKPVGPVFLTIGTGGVEIGRPDNIPKPYYEAYSDTGVFGILNLKIKEDGSSLEGTFYNNGDINEPYVQDTFNITKIN